MSNSLRSLRARLFNSLQGQLQVSTILVLFAGFTAASCASLWIDQRSLSEERIRALHERAETIHLCLEQITKTSAPAQLQQQLPACLQGRADTSFAFVLQQGDGQLILPRPASRYVPNSTIEQLVDSLEARSNLRGDLTLQRGGTYFLLHRHKPSTSGPQLIAIENLSEQARYFTGHLFSYVVIWVVLLILSAFAVSLVVSRALAPLRHLGSIADSITADNLPSTRMQLKHAPAEVADLARSYEKLLERLSESWANQKQFVSAVSHELRNPLTLVSGYLRRTLRRGDNLRADQIKGLGIADEETNRIIRLIGQLLDLSRSDCGTLTVELSSVRLANELQEVANLARTTLSRPIALHLPAGAAERALCVQANADRLRQVLMNLIENADKYSPGDAPLTLSLESNSQSMAVSVNDQGIGIPEQDLEFIFERFYRASNTTAVEGSGVGLAVVKVLVESMGASISVHSRVGEGTTFCIEFPLLHGSQSLIASATSSTP